MLHDRTLFVQLSSGAIQNSYDLKVLNKARATRRFEIAVDGLAGARMVLVGRSTRPAIPRNRHRAAGRTGRVPDPMSARRRKA